MIIKTHTIGFLLFHNCRFNCSTCYCNFGHNTCIWTSSGIFNLKETQPAPLFAALFSKSAEKKDIEIEKCLLFREKLLKLLKP